VQLELPATKYRSESEEAEKTTAAGHGQIFVLSGRPVFQQTFSMMKSEATIKGEATRMRNLIAKKKKFGDKFTTRDANTLTKLQARK
jgi:hypothetical protein